MTKRVRCESCGGQGIVAYNALTGVAYDCPDCKGSGRHIVNEAYADAAWDNDF